MELISNKKTKIKNKKNFYKLSKFKFLINQDKLNGENIVVTTNYNLPKSDTFYFKNAHINLIQNDFIASGTKIKVHKDIFDNSENDPRLIGVSSSKKVISQLLIKEYLLVVRIMTIVHHG